VADKTNDGLTLVCLVRPKEEFQRMRSNVESEFMRELEANAPQLAERVRAGRREERFAGTGFIPNFFRKPFGNGWALVGDAGCHKDPITAQGITNSFSHAEMLAEALDAAFSGRRPAGDALADYERRRNAEVMPMFDYPTQLARLEAPPAEMRQLLDALRGNRADTGRFLGTVAGTTPIPEFFSPENVGRIVSASALVPAA
jgi:flavin-dependent dehydrogenase